ncbi:MAG: hypothetical protein GXO35_09150 [Gammaproteobacteria bacterium]|nr:hypothetical protein [Gammaproteobacteria bacterium]
MDVLSLVFLYWSVVLIGGIAVIMLLCKATDTNRLGTSRPVYGSLALGTFLVDIAGLVFTGLPLIGTWCLRDLVVMEEYCRSITISAKSQHIFIFMVIVFVVWKRQRFLLNRGDHR